MLSFFFSITQDKNVLTSRKGISTQNQQSQRAERRMKKQKRKADEVELHRKREEMDKAKVRVYPSIIRATLFTLINPSRLPTL